MKTWLLRPLGQGLVLAMGSHHPLVAPLVPDKSYLILFRKNLLVKNKNNLAFHPGPVSPPGGDGSPFTTSFIKDSVEAQWHHRDLRT